MYINFKSKYKKIFWLIIGFLLACICVQKVNALDLNEGIPFGHITLDYNLIDSIWADLEGKTFIEAGFSSNGNSLNTTHVLHRQDYPYISYNAPNSIDGTYSITFYTNFLDTYNSSNIEYNSQFRFYSMRYIPNQWDTINITYRNWNTSTQSYTVLKHPTWWVGGGFQYYRKDLNTQINSYSSSITYTSFDIPSINWNKSFDYDPSGVSSPDYLNGYTKVTLPVGTQYTMISSAQITSGYVYIPIEDFNNYGGRLSYFDKDLSSQPYTSYIQEYTTTPDGLYARQYFDLSSYNGADWVMFSKYIYLDGEDNITYDIWVPSDAYSSLVEVTPNISGGNDFDFSYVDQNGELQADTISSVDLTPPQPLLGDMFQNFTSNDFGLTSIVTAPLPLIQSLNSSSCSDMSLPLGIFGGVHDNRLVLPCMTPVYENLFGNFFTLYQTITTGFIAYYVGLAFFNKIKQLKDPENDKIEVVDL